eukprot:Rhum_TRINITY_DN15045_c5_g1::Rhum_TRINITY_DN15045_c5_g1_i3::g.135081::m.135081
MEDSDSSSTISVDGWTCLQCSAENLCNDTQCQVCEVSRSRAPVTRGDSVPLRAAPPVPAPLVRPSSSQTWTCGQCTVENHGGDVCSVCDADRGLEQGTSVAAPSAPPLPVGPGAAAVHAEPLTPEQQPLPSSSVAPPSSGAAAVVPRTHVDPLSASAAASTASWECGLCTMLNESGSPACEACTAPMGTPAAAAVPAAGFAAGSPASPAAAAAWVCGTCTLENVASEAECAACGDTRPAHVAPPPPPPAAAVAAAAAAAGVPPAEWTCAHCTVVNTADVQVCGTCELPRGLAAGSPAVAAGAAASTPPQAFVTQAAAESRALQERDDAAAARALEAAEQAEEARRVAADEATARALEAESARLEQVRQERDALWAQSLQAAFDAEEMERAQDEAIAARLQDEEGCVRATCRFCEKTCAQPTHSVGVAAASCRNEECWRKDRVHCPALLGCGHPCIGTRGEQVHPQKCQHKDCCGEDSQDECAICFDELTEFPCVQLGCGHVYHHPCLLRQIDSAKDSLVPGKQISFNLLGCPQCKVVMQADAIRDEMSAAAALVAKVDAEARRVAEHEERGLLALSEADFQRETRKLFMFFLCKEPGCGKVFCGGRQACADAGGQGDPGAAPAAVCPDCQLAEMARQGIGKPCQSNPPHPNENLVRKCNYCCEVATFCCNLKGPIYMCNDCHSPPYHRRQNAKPCDPSKCAMRKLGKSHPEGITDGLIIGCLLCMGGALHP